jgi:hypothetical protein
LNPENADDLLKRLEEETSPALDRGAEFARARDLYASQGVDDKAGEAALNAALFQSVEVHAVVMSPPPTSRDAHSAPAERYRAPDECRTADALAYYARRLTSTQNPILKARYADFLWQQVPSSRERAKYGRSAVEAYIACASQSPACSRPGPGAHAQR